MLLSWCVQVKFVRLIVLCFRWIDNVLVLFCVCVRDVSYCRYFGLCLLWCGGLSIIICVFVSVLWVEILCSIKWLLFVSYSGVLNISLVRLFFSSEMCFVMWLVVWWICSGCYWVSGVWVWSLIIICVNGFGGVLVSS